MKVNVNFKKGGGGGGVIFFLGKPLVRHALTIVVDSFLMHFFISPRRHRDFLDRDKASVWSRAARQAWFKTFPTLHFISLQFIFPLLILLDYTIMRIRYRAHYLVIMYTLRVRL